jgi:hypothetical protein
LQGSSLTEEKDLLEEEDNNQEKGNQQHKEMEAVAQVIKDIQKMTSEEEDSLLEEEAEAKEENLDATDVERLDIDPLSVQRIRTQGQRNVVVTPTKEGEAKVQEVENVPETGESLLLKKVLLKPEKEVVEPTQRNTLFRTVCKVKGNVAR